MKDAAEKVRRALQNGELGADDLTARRLGSFLGRTTSVLYHHWGSLEGFLHAVTSSGMVDLASRAPPDADLADIADAYIDFALASPALYDLMFHSRPDWTRLREAAVLGDSPGLQLFRALVGRFDALGSDDPADDARVFYAGLHGLASLAISGRANVDDITTSDVAVAKRAARRLVAHLLPEDSP